MKIVTKCTVNIKIQAKIWLDNICELLNNVIFVSVVIVSMISLQSIVVVDHQVQLTYWILIQMKYLHLSHELP